MDPRWMRRLAVVHSRAVTDMSRRRRTQKDEESESDDSRQDDDAEESSDEGEEEKPTASSLAPSTFSSVPEESPKVSMPDRSPKVVKAKDVRQPRDPASVPRRGQFFLHDDRAGRGHPGDRRLGSKAGSAGDSDFNWAHDKFEELVASPEPKPRKSLQGKQPRERRESREHRQDGETTEVAGQRPTTGSSRQRDTREPIVASVREPTTGHERKQQSGHVDASSERKQREPRGGPRNREGRGQAEARSGRQGRGRGGRGATGDGRLVYSTGMELTEAGTLAPPPGLAVLNPTARAFLPTPSPTSEADYALSLPEPPALEAVASPGVTVPRISSLTVPAVAPTASLSAPAPAPVNLTIPAPAMNVMLPEAEDYDDRSYDPGYSMPVYDPSAFMYMQDPMFMPMGGDMWYPDMNMNNMYMGDMYYMQMPVMHSQHPAYAHHAGGRGAGRGPGRGRGGRGRGSPPLDFPLSS